MSRKPEAGDIQDGESGQEVGEELKSTHRMEGRSSLGGGTGTDGGDEHQEDKGGFLWTVLRRLPVKVGVCQGKYGSREAFDFCLSILNAERKGPDKRPWFKNARSREGRESAV